MYITPMKPKRPILVSPRIQSQVRSLFGSSVPRIRGLLEYFLEKGLLFDALNALCILEQTRAPTTLTELAAQYVRHLRTSEMVAQISLTELIYKYSEMAIREKRATDDSRYRLLAVAVQKSLGDSFPVDSLTRKDVDLLTSRYDSPVSKNHFIILLRAILRWGKREHLSTNPLAEHIRPTPELYSPPTFFQPEQVERILRISEEHPGRDGSGIGMALAMGFLAGIRTVEIKRAQWEDVLIEDHVIRIPHPKGFTRGVRARVVELEANATEWCAHWRDVHVRLGHKPKGPILHSTDWLAKWKKEFLEPEGLSWGNDAMHNAMRHTYATMHVGAFRDLKATALNLGRMEHVDSLVRHYMGLVSADVARRYWEIRPRERGSYAVVYDPRMPRRGRPRLTSGRRDGEDSAKEVQSASSPPLPPEPASPPPPSPSPSLADSPEPSDSPSILASTASGSARRPFAATLGEFWPS